MRCTGPPCQGTYCWRDPDNRKHYKLDTSVLIKLIDYAEEGNTLRTHGDVPPKSVSLLAVVVWKVEEQVKAQRLLSLFRAGFAAYIPNARWRHAKF